MMGMPGPPVSAAEASGANSETTGDISVLTPSTPLEKVCPRLRRTAIKRRALALRATWKRFHTQGGGTRIQAVDGIGDIKGMPHETDETRALESSGYVSGFR